MRTNEEIVEKLRLVVKEDFFGFSTSDYLCRLPFELAKEFLKDDATEEDWKECQKPNTREAILEEMKDYMGFAWGKAKNCRGLSAGRSMAHYAAWVWLLGDDLGDLEDYQYYGKDNLVKICDHYGWDHKQWDDGIRSNVEV